MTQHEEPIRLRHMLDHAREAIALAQGKTKDDFKRDRLLQLGLVRLVEIIGEAATRVSQEIVNENPSIPWPRIRGTRNRLIHEYDKIDLDVLWDTINLDLPPLVRELERILNS